MQLAPLDSAVLQMLPEHVLQLKESGSLLFKSENLTEANLASSMKSIAMTLGQLAAGRSREYIERLVPYDQSTSRPPSLSANHGLTPFPLHTDTAHWYTPARYIILGCSVVGDWAVPTILFDHMNLPAMREYQAYLRSAPFKISNGRRSFYAPVLDRNRGYFRFDRDCMSPASTIASQIMHDLSRQLVPEGTHQHLWEAGDVLVIDNWRFLHGRGIHAEAPKNRVLLRAMIV